MKVPPRRDPLTNVVMQVGRWVWKNYSPKASRRLSAAEVTVRQAQAGRASSAVRASRSRSLVLEAVRGISARGEVLTRKAVHERLRAEGHSLSLRTVGRHWSWVEAAATRPL